MIDLSVVTGLAGINIGTLADKTTTLTRGQKEAATSLWVSPDGAMDIGVWECSPGSVTADRSAAADFCYFLHGKIVMTHLDGTRCELGPSDAIRLPRGLKSTWDILEHTRKIYVFLADRT